MSPVVIGLIIAALALFVIPLVAIVIYGVVVSLKNKKK